MVGVECNDWGLSKRNEREIQTKREREREIEKSAMERPAEIGVMQLQANQCPGLTAPSEMNKR